MKAQEILDYLAAPHIAGERPTSPITNSDFVLADDIVQAVVTPAGQLVIAYSDARRAPRQRHDVSLVWSTDGTSWSTPLAVSDSGPETAWLPAITSSADGSIAVSYFAADFSRGEAGTRVLLQQLRPSAGGFTRFERIELDLPRNRDLSPVELGSRHGSDEYRRPTVVFPEPIAVFKCFGKVLGALPFWHLGHLGLHAQSLQEPVRLHSPVG